jgi:hypothetical protein
VSSFAGDAIETEIDGEAAKKERGREKEGGGIGGQLRKGEKKGVEDEGKRERFLNRRSKKRKRKKRK